MMTVVTVTDDVSFQEAFDRACPPVAGPGADSEVLEKIEATRRIVEGVRRRGDAAVAEYTEQFDGVALPPSHFEVDAAEMDRAMAAVDPALLAALERAYANIFRFHSQHLRASWEETFEDGTILGQRITPIERVGVHVPGGKAFYPSSVLMNVAPAKVAGVKEIIMVSPPSHHGSIHPVVLAAARVAGVSRVFRIGGAQSIAALAYGTERVPAVLKITGPGNFYVTAAKRLVSTVCDIDKEAGPSEVVVIADGNADVRLVAAELLAQAEHDEEACSILITPCASLAERVQMEVSAQAAALPRTGIIERSLTDHGVIVVVRDLEEAAHLADLIAPEHLSIQTDAPRATLDLVQNAGAAMLGGMTPVALGDYYAGPNHILPTGRRARFASPLTTEDFRKATSILWYSHERLVKDSDDVIRLAQAEGLRAHARAVEMRK
jgi:histidinol dehydrogenase